MNRKEFLKRYRKHVREMAIDDRESFENWLELMQHGGMFCPFVDCKPDHHNSKEALYFSKYHLGKPNDIVNQMVQVYCEVVFK